MRQQPAGHRHKTRPSSPSEEAGGEVVANGEPFRPTPGPPLAKLPFESAYRRIPMTAEERERYERPLALWDRATQTALEVRDTSPQHEYPAALLPALLERIGQVRGKAIRCFGTMSLFLLGEDGLPERTMQADQCLYLHPERANLRGRSAMVVGEDRYPDVVIEVDNTTDVRRHKLQLYESWGFPEIWVEVPDTSPRPAKWHGLTVHVLKDGAYKESPASRAFPGWDAADIHAALNEVEFSANTSAILERVGAELGEREGTGPYDDPLLRTQREATRREALAQARAEELQRRAAMVSTILACRGLPTTPRFPLDAPGFPAAAPEMLASAAMRCADEADFATLLAKFRKRDRE